MDIFQAYRARFQRAGSPREKMLLIDRLIHAFHISLSAVGRPAAANLIQGSLREVIHFLDGLSVPLLAQHFLAAVASKYRKTITALSSDAVDHLLRAAWPGNVPQLFNAIEKCVGLARGPIISLALAERALNRPGDDMASFDDARRSFEREYLVQLLKLTHGNVTNAAGIAKRNRSDFYTLLNRHTNRALPVQEFLVSTNGYNTALVRECRARPRSTNDLRCVVGIQAGVIADGLLL